MADHPKKIVKFMKKCGIASFYWGERVRHVSKKIIKWFPHKKIPNFQPSGHIPTDGKEEEQAKYNPQLESIPRVPRTCAEDDDQKW